MKNRKLNFTDKLIGFAVDHFEIFGWLIIAVAVALVLVISDSIYNKG